MATKKPDRPSLAETDDLLNILYYGRPKTAKTTHAATAAKHGQVEWVDAEAGIKKKPLINRGIPVANIHPFTDIEIEALDEFFWDVKANLPYAMVLDSVTEIHKKLLETTAATSRQKGIDSGKFPNRAKYTTEVGDYGTNTGEMRAIFRKYRDLKCHTVFVALERRDQDEDTGVVTYGPDLTPKLASDLLGFVDVICHTYTVNTGEEEPEYWGDFRNIGVYEGGDRFGAVPPKLIDPTFERVLAYVNGELTLESDPLMASHVEEPELDDNGDPVPRKARKPVKKAVRRAPGSRLAS
jgi:hypothetical protein